jgi:EmrB/QacA subfamily drug resistance transporter
MGKGWQSGIPPRCPTCPSGRQPGPPAGTHSRTGELNRTTPLILAVALFMENMDSTVISTSLPAIAQSIGTSPIALKLALTAYLVSLAVFIPISGWMADRFGAKRVFRTALGVFIVGSVGCAVAGSLGEIVAARIVQGLGGAMMTPVARLLLVRSVPRTDLMGAMAWLTIPALVGPLMGPPVGGFITTVFGWHWIFLINVPIGVAGIWLAGRFLADVPPTKTEGVDLPGFALSALAASGVVFGLSVISLPALPTWVGLAALAVGVVAALLYRRHARRTARPLLDLALFRNRTFAAAIAGGTLFRIGVGAAPFLLPLLLQLGFGLTPFESGSITFASAVGALTMKFGARRILRGLGFRTALALCSVVSAGFVAANAFFTQATPAALIFATLLLAGFVRSLFFTSANALVFADIAENETSQATAISAASQQISIALGVALAGGILEAQSWATGEPIAAPAFMLAFAGTALVTALAALPFLFMPRDAGRSVSGHMAKQDVDSRQPMAV